MGEKHLVILCVCFIMMITVVDSLIAQDGKTIRDLDGNTYKTVKIGKQTWMAENLKTTRYRDGTTIPLVADDKAWGNRTSPGYSWYKNDTDINKNIYGALYNWYTVATGNLCPTGWHVPCDAEWATLETTLGGSNIAGGKMKEKNNAHWNASGIGVTNETDFKALPGGYRFSNGTFSSIGDYGFWWSSTEFRWSLTVYYMEYAWGRYMSYYISDVYRYYFSKKYGFSVRCLNDTTPSISTTTVTKFTTNSAIVGSNVSSDSNIPVTGKGVYWGTSQNPGVTGKRLQMGSGTGSFSIDLVELNPNTTYYVCAYATNSIGTAYGEEISFTTSSPAVALKDIEGNVYKTVTIGSQVWMAENLKTTKYNNGISIPQVTDATSWNNLSTAAYCWYNNDAATYKAAYGALYNWYTVNTGKLCPSGWHVPTDAEWTILTDYLSGARMAGGKLKEAGTAHWISPNTGATNESGFTALPGGLCVHGTFTGVGDDGGWWSSGEYKADYALGRRMQSVENSVGLRYDDRKQTGFSVRCVKEH